jgi:hypothetical protein
LPAPRQGKRAAKVMHEDHRHALEIAAGAASLARNSAMTLLF